MRTSPPRSQTAKLPNSPRLSKEYTSKSAKLLVCAGMAVAACAGVLALTGCGAPPWNDPNSKRDRDVVTFYSSFTERPKHLDPARSYTSNEWAFISQIYEPPLQYHFLRRPYALTTLTAAAMPLVERFDSSGAILPDDADPQRQCDGGATGADSRIH